MRKPLFYGQQTAYVKLVYTSAVNELIKTFQEPHGLGTDTFTRKVMVITSKMAFMPIYALSL